MFWTLYLQFLKLFAPKLDMWALCIMQDVKSVKECSSWITTYNFSPVKIRLYGKMQKLPGPDFSPGNIDPNFRDVWHTYPLEQQNPIHARHSLLCHNERGNLSQTVQIHGKVAASQNWERLNNKIAQNTSLLFVSGIFFIFIFYFVITTASLLKLYKHRSLI